MTEFARRETMWFTQRPDCYGGSTCDQIEARWHCYADGDKDSDEQREPLTLDPSSFPPGTKITVEEPICPTCSEPRSIKHPRPDHGNIFEDKCDCGFDWGEWTLHHFA